MDELEIEDIPVPINNDLERRIAEAFEIFDHAGNKTIDVREVGTVVRSLGCAPSEAEIQEIILGVEESELPGCVHLRSFLPYVSQMITEHRYETAPADKLLEAFHVLDPEKLGYISKDYFVQVMTEYGEPFNTDEIEEMLEITIDPYSQNIPYEYYINKLMYDAPEDRSAFRIADAIEAAKPPPPPPPRTFSEQMRDLQELQNQEGG